jgi:hypothetical protein
MQWFKAAGVGAKHWSVDGHSTLLFGWHGDTVQDALTLLLTAKGMQASNEGVARRISSTDHQHLLRSLQEFGTGAARTPSCRSLRLNRNPGVLT